MLGSRHSLVWQTDFLRAVFAELERVVEQDHGFWTVATRLPVVPHAVQLSLLGILLLKGVKPGSHDDVDTHRDELEVRLEKAYRASKIIWFEASMLGDSRQHPGSNLITIMECEDIIRIVCMFQRLV